MKIAFIVSEFPSLSQTFILNQITGLLDRGHDVDIYPLYPSKDVTVHQDIIRYGLLHRTSFRQIPRNRIVRTFKALAYVTQFIVKTPLPVIKSLNIFKYGKKAANLSVLYEIAPFLTKGPYDIVHCHFGPCGLFGAFLKDLQVSKGKFITAFHGYDMSKFLRHSPTGVYDSLFLKGDLFLPISDCWKEQLIKLGCKANRIVVHRMGIDTQKFSFRPRQPKKEAQIHLLTIARLVEKKGVAYSIQAVGKIVKRFPNIRYKIIGDGPLKRTLDNLIDDLTLRQYVTLLGWKEQEEVMRIMQEADILLAPSVTSQDGDQEGIPVVLMEALAQGMPVVSTYHSGIPELVQHNKSGLLANEHDVDGLVENLDYLLQHQEIWEEMGKEGRRHIERNHDANKLNDNLVELYKALLNDNNSTAWSYRANHYE